MRILNEERTVDRNSDSGQLIVFEVEVGHVAIQHRQIERRLGGKLDTLSGLVEGIVQWAKNDRNLGFESDIL